MTTPTVMTLTLDARLYFDARANQALTQTRTAWVALGELLSGEPVLPGALEQATGRYHEALMQLGLQALRTSYLNPPDALGDLPAQEDETAEEEVQEVREPVAPQVRRAPSAPVEPAQPKAPEVAPMTARVVQPAPVKKLDAAQLMALKEQLGQPTSWSDEADATTHAAHAARALDEQVRAMCVTELVGWRQAIATLDKLGSLVESRARWQPLRVEDRAELLSALAAMIRHVEAMGMPAHQHEGRMTLVIALKKRVLAMRNADASEFVYGLANTHTPRHGGDWWQDARHILGLILPAAPARTEPTPAEAPTEPAEQTAEVSAAPQVQRENPHPHVKGERWAVVGGDRRGKRADVLCELLELGSMEWVDTAPDKHKHVDNLCERIKSGSVDAVVILKQYINHGATKKILAKSKKQRVPMIWVESYGEQQLITAIAHYHPAR